MTTSEVHLVQMQWGSHHSVQTATVVAFTDERAGADLLVLLGKCVRPIREAWLLPYQTSGGKLTPNLAAIEQARIDAAKLLPTDKYPVIQRCILNGKADEHVVFSMVSVPLE